MIERNNNLLIPNPGTLTIQGLSASPGYNLSVTTGGLIIATAGGSGGGETLAQTLAIGNSTGGNNIVMSNNDKIVAGGASGVAITSLTFSVSGLGSHGTNSIVITDNSGNLSTEVTDWSNVFVRNAPVPYNDNATTLYKINFGSSNAQFQATEINFPLLTTLTQPSSGNSSLQIVAKPTLTTLYFPLLTNVIGRILVQHASGGVIDSINFASLTQSSNINLQGPLVTSINIDNLETADNLNLSSLDILSTLNLSNFKYSSVNVSINSCASLTSINLGNLILVNALEINPNTTSLTTLLLGTFSTVGSLQLRNLGGFVGPLNLSGLTQGDQITIADNADLIGITMSSLTTNLSVGLDFGNSPSLLSIDISSLINVGGFLHGNACSSLTTILINNAIDTIDVSFTSCALDQTTVDNILIALDTAGNSNGTVDLSGGTSASPSVTGAAAAASLIGKGWTVNTN